MRGILAKRPSAAIVVSVIALVMAMGGVGYAAGGGLTTKKVKTLASSAAKTYFKNHIGAASVAHAGTADSATNATTASNANSLGGVAASGYTRRDCSLQTGALKGWAVVNASATFPSTYTAVSGYNCSGGAVQARRVGVGLYEVQFVTSPVTAVVATVNGGAAPAGFVDSHEVGPGDFVLGTRNTAGTLTDGHGFALVTP